MTPLRLGTLALFACFLLKGDDLNDDLLAATRKGDLPAVKALLDKGVDVNVEDTFYHAAALTWAIEKKHIEIVKILLDHGAKSPAQVLSVAVQSGNPELAKSRARQRRNQQKQTFPPLLPSPRGIRPTSSKC